MKKQLFSIFAIITFGAFVLIGCESDDSAQKADTELSDVEDKDNKENNSDYNPGILATPDEK